MSGVAKRRRLGAAAFVFVCAPCFAGFLAFVLPPLAGAATGSVLGQSLTAAAVGATVAVVAALLWRRRRSRLPDPEVCPAPGAVAQWR